MASPIARNVIAVLCITCLICGAFILWAPHTTTNISADTVLYSEQYDGEIQTDSTSTLKKAVKSTLKKKNNIANKKSSLQAQVEEEVVIVEVNQPEKIEVTTPLVVTDSAVTTSTSSSTTSTASHKVTDTLTDADLTTAGSSDLKVVKSPSKENGMTTKSSLNLTDFKMDFETSDNIGDMLDARRSHIYDTCNKFSTAIDDSISTDPIKYALQILKNKNTVTDHKNELTFCTVAKSGSTFWKSVFIYIGKGEIKHGLSGPRVLRKNSFRSLSMWDNAKSRGEDYTSFVAVRNPWKRLVSLYQQKIESFLPRLEANGFKLAKKMAPYKYMLKVCHTKPSELKTFADMLECVLEHDKEHKPNRHWTTAYEYCDICNMDFSYIIRTENMMKEGAYVMEQAGIDEADKILTTVREGTIRDVEKHKSKPYSEYYRDIDTDTINRLRDIYQWEIELFQYPDTPFTA